MEQERDAEAGLLGDLQEPLPGRAPQGGLRQTDAGAGRATEDARPAACNASGAFSDDRLVVVPVVTVGRIRIAAAALSEATAHEVASGDDRHVEPGVSGDEFVGPVGVAPLDHGSGDEDA